MPGTLIEEIFRSTELSIDYTISHYFTKTPYCVNLFSNNLYVISIRSTEMKSGNLSLESFIKTNNIEKENLHCIVLEKINDVNQTLYFELSGGVIEKNIDKITINFGMNHEISIAVNNNFPTLMSIVLDGKVMQLEGQ